jgi:hypothetical protein
MVKEEPPEETRQERREEKRRRKKERMKQHGKGLAQMYRDAVEKRRREKG